MYQYRRPGVQRHWPLSHTSSTSTHARIDRLESLFRTAIENSSTQNVASVGRPSLRPCDTTNKHLLTYGSGDSVTISRSDDHGDLDEVLRIEDDSKHGSNIGGAHWDALLGRVCCSIAINNVHRLYIYQLSEVRIHMQRRNRHYQEQNLHINRVMRPLPGTAETSLFLGSAEYRDRSAIVSRVPSRHLCDILVSQYFRSLEPALRKLTTSGGVIFKANESRYTPRSHVLSSGMCCFRFLEI